MNMIPLVKAIEPGSAQSVNLQPSCRIVVLRGISSLCSDISVIGKCHYEG